jgi:hypothetical protein
MANTICYSANLSYYSVPFPDQITNCIYLNKCVSRSWKNNPPFDLDGVLCRSQEHWPSVLHLQRRASPFSSTLTWSFAMTITAQISCLLRPWLSWARLWLHPAASWTSARWSTNYKDHSLQNKNQGLFVHQILFHDQLGHGVVQLITLGLGTNWWMLVE